MEPISKQLDIFGLDGTRRLAETEGRKSRTVNLGASFSAFMRSLGLAITGGKRGTIGAVREQSLRIAQCSFTMQWSADTTSGSQTVVSNTRIVDRLELWQSDRSGWSETVELSERFHASGSIFMPYLPIGCRVWNVRSICVGRCCWNRSALLRRPRILWRIASGRSCRTS